MKKSKPKLYQVFVSYKEHILMYPHALFFKFKGGMLCVRTVTSHNTICL